MTAASRTIFLDAEDDLARVRDVLALIGMTCRTIPDDDQKALATGVDLALDFLLQAQDGFRAFKDRELLDATPKEDAA